MKNNPVFYEFYRHDRSHARVAVRPLLKIRRIWEIPLIILLSYNSSFKKTLSIIGAIFQKVA